MFLVKNSFHTSPKVFERNFNYDYINPTRYVCVACHLDMTFIRVLLDKNRTSGETKKLKINSPWLSRRAENKRTGTLSLLLMEYRRYLFSDHKLNVNGIDGS